MTRDFHNERLLILTKTYPQPSAKYRETTCVAAITENGEFRRVFPVPYRLIEGEHQFKKWEWIEARVGKSSDDHRPESYRIDVESIRRTREVLSTKDGWSNRLYWISPHIFTSFESLEERRIETGKTLGILRPSCLLGLDITELSDKEKDWTPKEKSRLLQEGLFDSKEIASRIPLRKIPYQFHYRYACETPQGIKEYRHKITDWEAGMLYWNCVHTPGTHWESLFRKRLEEEFSKKDVLFLLGTVHRFPHQWLIIGLIYPPKPSAVQMRLDFAL